MSEISEATKYRYTEGLKKMTEAAYEVMVAWEDEGLSDLLMHSDIENTYKRVFTASFDEWWHELFEFREIAEKILKYELKDGDCVNCIHGSTNDHHNREIHFSFPSDYQYPTACSVTGCDCLGYTTLAMSRA